MPRLLALALTLVLLAAPAAAQHAHGTPSDGRAGAETGLFMGLRVDPANPPPGSGLGRAFAHLNDSTYAHVTYGVPYRRGRVVFGGLVGYGELWAMGAHFAAELVLTQPVRAGGQRVEAGVYTVFATPGETMWTLHLNTALGMHRADRYDPANDALAVRVPVEPLAEPVEAFTMDFEPAEDGADLRVSWDRTRVRLPLRPVYR
jgi:hypothetical protein